MAQLRIKEILKEKGISQKELADRIGFTYAGISKALNGNPSLATLEKIASALGVEISALFVVKKVFITCPYCKKAIPVQTEVEEV